ncbi:MAG TPA: efflux RND transporter periplasmic adaptor subunit [Candidatus Acidoferrales bacterium]|nr:efflux RND transporter periplasmic adaptor subunit [Candidatus Acidoferrales bacterium]
MHPRCSGDAEKCRKTSWLWIAALLLPLWGCGGQAPAAGPAPETVAGLRVEIAQLETLPNEVAAPGTVASIHTAQLAARVMGTVESVLVREGNPVRQGQTLVVLDDREFAAGHAAAEAAVQEAAASRQQAQRAVTAAAAQADLAEKTYRRYVFLRDQKSVSPQEFDVVETQQRAAQAALAQAQAGQAQAVAGYRRAQEQASAASTAETYTKIIAPFDGVVLERFVDPGTMATPGLPLLSVEETSRYRLEAVVDAEKAAAIRLGMPVPVKLDALPGKSFPGTVAEIEPGANPVSHTVQVKIDLPRDPALRSGLFGRALFRQGERRAIVVPESAILERGQLRGVYLVDSGGIIHLRLVTLGAGVGAGGREALSGVEAGERVVANPGTADLDGKRAEARP